MAPVLEFIVVGAGGHGKVVADLVRAAGHVVAGYADVDSTRLDAMTVDTGSRIAVSQAELEDVVHSTGALPPPATALAIALGDNAARLALFSRMTHIHVPPLIHPSAIVSPSARVGDGTVVMPAVVMNAAVRIGHAAIVNSGAIIEHDCVVGDGAHVSPGAVLAGSVRVGERSWIGAGATIIPGVTIGVGATIAAGAVVIRDVPDDTLAMGVPATARSRAGQ